MNHNDENDLVNVAVPRSRLRDVYRLLGEETNGRTPTATAPSGKKDKVDNQLPGDWTENLIRKMYRESPDTAAAILRRIAERAEDDVPSKELIDILTEINGKQANSLTLAGTMGAYGRRVHNRYKQKHWPFEANFSYEEGQYHYKMSSAVAEIIKSLT